MNFGITIAEIQPKSRRENNQMEERENVECRQRECRNSTAQFCCPSAVCPSVECCWKKKKKKAMAVMPLPKYGNKFFFLAIVAMTLPKMGKKKKSGSEISRRVKKSFISIIFSQ